jgi:hypothetical protein
VSAKRFNRASVLSSRCQAPKAKLRSTFAIMPRQKPPLDPDVADTAPSDSVLTVYDEEHIITCLRLLDANAEGADWKEVARIVLRIDPDREPAPAPNAFESHLARAKSRRARASNPARRI